jgi:site-specific recombinase XerD
MEREKYDRFMSAQVQSQQLSETTREKYDQAIDRLEAWLPDGVDEPSIEHIRDFILTRASDNGVAGSTLNVDKCAIKKYLVAYNRPDEYPELKIWFQENFRSTSGKRQDHLTEDETEAFLAAAADDPCDHAIAAILLATGIRVSELVALDREDIDLDAGKVTIDRRKRHEVRTGGDQQRQQGVIEQRSLTTAQEAVERFLDHRAEYTTEDGVTDEALFVTPAASDDGSFRMSTETVRNRVNDIAERTDHADVTRTRVKPHLMRHTVGSRLGEQGYTAKQIAAFLGQGDPQSAQRYTHASEETIEEMSDVVA